MSDELDELFEDETIGVEALEQTEEYDAFMRKERIRNLAADLYVHRRGLSPQQAVEQARNFYEHPSVQALSDD